MIKIILLVCSVSTPVQECSLSNAVSFTSGPKVDLPYQCMSQGQNLMAKTPLTDEHTYLKISCERNK